MTEEIKKIVHPKIIHKKNHVINKDKPLSKNIYVENAEFCDMIIKYKEGDRSPRLMHNIGKTLMQIANGFSQKHQWRNYPFREDMVAEAVAHCWRYFESFDPSVTKNPFSYFTQTCYYNFLATIETEREALAAKFKSSLHVIAEHGDRIREEIETGDHDPELTAEYQVDTSAMSEFVGKYDNYLKTKKEKAKRQKAVAKLGKVDQYLG